ncbi:MAG: rRNA maturation RNase YbeY [Vampirovibrionales bacterium]|nr:rRNA maturation RNase YbeY [Vampirovibrionales bacterium]
MPPELNTQMNAEFSATLSLGMLGLDVYADKACLLGPDASLLESLMRDIASLWPVFQDIIQAEKIPAALGLNDTQGWEADLTFCDNETIQSLNAQYRHKNQATDVLSFCLFADQPQSQRAVMAKLPLVSLGSVFVSIAWAKAEAEKTGQDLSGYILERVFHGFLHLLGAHHDTMPDYERVKKIQATVLASRGHQGA